MRYYLKISRPEQITNELLREHRTGFTWGNCTIAKCYDPVQKSAGANIYDDIYEDDIVYIYAKGTGLISHICTVLSATWAPLHEKAAFMKAHEGAPEEDWIWVHHIYFKSIRELIPAYDLRRNTLPSMNKFKQYSTALLNCSAWMLRPVDHDAIMSKVTSTIERM